MENEYEDAIQDKLIAKQRERRAQIEQEIEKLEEEIDQINSMTDAKVEEIYALSEAEALKIRGIAEAEADDILFSWSTAAYKDANAELALYDNTDQDRETLFHFIYMNQFRYIDSQLNLVLGFEDPLVQVDT